MKKRKVKLNFAKLRKNKNLKLNQSKDNLKESNQHVKIKSCFSGEFKLPEWCEKIQ